MTVNDVLLVFKGIDFNKKYEKEFEKDLAKRSENKYSFGDIRVCPYECIDSWQRFNETSFPGRKKKLQQSKMEDIKGTRKKNLGEFQITKFRCVS